MRHVLWVIGCLLFVGWTARARAADDAALAPLYERIARDVQQGRPLRVRVYVALCDNASQGIVPVKNPAICDGDVPAHNIYWGTRGGLSGFARAAGFRRIESTPLASGPIAVRTVWRKRVRSIDVELEGLAYRGREIRTAMLDFVRAVHSDDANGASPPHVVAYVGHNYFLDTSDVRDFREAARAGGAIAKGIVPLSCLGDQHIRPYITRDRAEILLLNTNLAYPGAWSLGGAIDGLVRRDSARGVRDSAARAFAAGMNKPFGTMRAAFGYGVDRPAHSKR
jgi:hypothetical protein